MKNIRLAVVSVLMLSFCFTLKADEGMWLPMHIKRLNYADMQRAGLKLTAEEIYDVNNSCLKDAIVVLSGGSCTAEMISANGLMLTNHHCAFGVIQANSAVEHDYLTDGFWAMSRDKELPAEGMTAGFLIRMEDVTERVLADVTSDMSEVERGKKIHEAYEEIEKEAIGETHYEANVKSFFDGNEYYLFVYEVFKDVRLVGAPPSSIGKFGGDTDNWMWPRQTGDFSLLRVYCDKDGKPAEYSEDNVPYQPKHHLPISLNGVEKGDYAMIMGYPGSTDRYLRSPGVKQQVEKVQPTIVQIREKRLALLKEDMNASDEVRIKYASKYARISNYYKYFKGQTKGLKRLKVYDQKAAEELAFIDWVHQNEEREAKYDGVVDEIHSAYDKIDKYAIARTYLNEAAFGNEIMLMCFRASSLSRILKEKNPDPAALNAAINRLKDRAKSHFEDYNAPTDKKVFAAMLEMYSEGVSKELQPELFKKVTSKYKGDFEKFADYVFKKSVFASEKKLMEFFRKPSSKGLEGDPAYRLTMSFLGKYRSDVSPHLGEAFSQLDSANRLFVAGLREMNPKKKYYPNANSSMRITYGNVLDYYPRDAVYYDYYTTLEGVMEKEDPKDDEFIVPAKLRELYEKKDYGRYGQDGEMRVCFITNNDITGGNSGSPVINANGELIGCAFDGNWEAMSGDIAFEHKLQRTIAVDVRYILFIIDKYAGASHLVKEMNLVESKKEAANKPAPQSMEKPVPVESN